MPAIALPHHRKILHAVVTSGALPMAPAITWAQVRVIISGGFSGPYEQLLPELEKTTGIRVTTGSGASQGSGPQTIGAQLARGVVADVVILSREGLAELIKVGRIAPGTDVDLARTPLPEHLYESSFEDEPRSGLTASARREWEVSITAALQRPEQSRRGGGMQASFLRGQPLHGLQRAHDQVRGVLAISPNRLGDRGH